MTPEQAEHFRRENEALLAKLPEWRRDPKKAAAEMKQLREDLVREYGFKKEDVEIIPLHQNVLMARDALAYRKEQKEKAVREAPRHAASPPAPTAAEHEQHKRRMDAARVKARKAKGLHAQADAVLELAEGAHKGPATRK